MFKGVTADTDLVPDNWAGGSASNVINIKRLSSVKGSRGVVKVVACAATGCA